MCLKCAGGCQIGKICTCHPNPWQPSPVLGAGLGGGSSGALQSSSGGTSSGSNAGGSGSGTDQLLSKCFRGPPGLEVEGAREDAPGPTTAWSRLLRGHQHPQAPASSVYGAPLHANVAARRRHENAAWRHWWAAHQRGEGGALPGELPAHLLFPPTPTSTYPGTPRGDEPSPFGCFGQPLVAPVVYFPVPVHLAVYVQQFLETLLAHPPQPPITELPHFSSIWSPAPDMLALFSEGADVQPPLPEPPYAHS
mmetsp:Transcript_107334/g.346616  ORF Transcript_107334/g.346616 Transcript_107334/m.346616 type:complete len:251 (-) Transcript_107334:38-790(-)